MNTPSPTRDPNGFVEALLTIGRALAKNRAVLFYDGDADLQCISEHRDALSEYFPFVMPDRNLIAGFLDKQKFSALAEEYSLRVPKSAVLKWDGSVAALKELRFPVILKPMSRVGWLDSESVWDVTRGAKGVPVNRPADIDRILSKWNDSVPDFLAQEIVPGPESNVVSYHAYISEDGDCLGEYTGRKRRTFPSEFGRSSHLVVDLNTDVLEEGRGVSKKLKLTGAIKLDFKRDPRDGLLYLFEVNPRFSIWNYPAKIAGVNLLEIAYTDQIDTGPTAIPKIVRQATWVDGSLDRRSMNLGYIRYAMTVVSLLFRKSATFNIWSCRDPMPFFASLAYKFEGRLGRLFRKMLRKYQK